ncbi:Predicted pyrophosphatase or phosphodiesterase, AlkP superfamily [Microterricola viridarii]|uniref:Predicted pyrophosphatase or phosphodiesterase, AlkP superfamily n=1 Tax=Microterricola viridarii TaxID=412690 RepID=A0A1H1UW50_9MICO|nr:Predicted pyrophosphatase or phosphodiesterase, AlkP superfamily [Microterricola viridarii]
MLPARISRGPRLADVLRSCLQSVRAEPNVLSLPASSHAIVLLVDGLGASALRSRSGHARFLASRMAKSDVIEGVFPATTASAIATLTTASAPGEHGMVGYSVLDAENDRLVNQLKGWDAQMRPESWQLRRTVFEQAQDAGVPAFAIGTARYADSGLTHAVLRGASYVSADTLEERFAAAQRVIDSTERAIVYLYVAELDMAAHAKGWESDKWLGELEKLDSALARFAGGLRKGVGVLLTADHGIVDVPLDKHVLYDTVPELIAGVRHVGGEPRCLQLYLEPGLPASAADELAESWRRVEGDRVWVSTRAEAIADGLFGDVDPRAEPRIGDVLVAARKLVAYYDSRDITRSGRSMIGQHGSLSDEEMRIPLVRLGAFSR